MRVTRIAYSKNLNHKKYMELETQAKLLGQFRSEVWQKYGSLAGVKLKDREIRDQFLKQDKKFPVSANAWKETLRDAIADIKANREAAKVKARRAIFRHTNDKEEQKRLFQLLQNENWTEDPYLRRIMRKACSRGHNHTHNQIIVRSDDYNIFATKDKIWIKIPSLNKGKRLAIPLNTTVAPKGTLRLILKDNKVEIHYSIEVPKTQDCGENILGIDKGFTEVLVDSDGEHHGEKLGEKLSSESNILKLKYQQRNKLRALANSKPHKKKRILRNNLGRKKLDRRQAKTKAQVKDVVYKAVHKVVDKAKTIAAEDLTAPMCVRKFGKDVNRRLSSWTKGVIAEALKLVSQRRGSTLHLVNAAYTSQMDSRNGALLGQRKGDSFYCLDGEILHADVNAARNILARLFDSEIDRWTSHLKVKSILLERTERLRLGLLNQDSSCSDILLSTESEMPNGQFCPIF